MDSIFLIGSTCFILLLALIIPGPDFLMIVKNSLQYSRRTGIYTAIGLGFGIALHISYCLAGLAIIISKSIIIFNILKLLGAAYLIYIGLHAFFSTPSDIKIKNQKHKTDISPLRAIKIGFFTNALNPKATLFFLSLFTMVIPVNTENSILLLISFLMISMTIIWFILVSIFFTQPKVQKTFNKLHNIFQKFFGGILVSIGIKIALTGK